MTRYYLDFIEDIIDSINKIEIFTKGMSYEDFVKDDKTLYAVRTALQIIGEAASKVPSEIRTEYDYISWKEMKALRNKIVHEYFGLNVRLIWEIINRSVPVLKEQISSLKQQFSDDSSEREK